MSKNFNVKESVNWDKGLKFEVACSKSGIARVYIADRKTKYYAGGWGDKETTVIAKMINDLAGEQDYKDYFSGEGYKTLHGGTGFTHLKTVFESLPGNNLDKIYATRDSNIYEIYFNGCDIK